jgi:hypothetical protein
MTSREKYLYHQVHPLKLAADFGAGFGSLYPFWQHRLWIGLVALLLPPVIASASILRFSDLVPYKESPFGRYVARLMTPAVEAIRLVGMTLMALGASISKARFSPSVRSNGTSESKSTFPND